MSHLPVMFFTVQKSSDKSRIILTKLPIKLLLYQPHRRYTRRAKLLNIRWKNVITGCFNLLVVDWSKLSKVLLSMKGLEPFMFISVITKCRE